MALRGVPVSDVLTTVAGQLLRIEQTQAAIRGQAHRVEGHAIDLKRMLVVATRWLAAAVLLLALIVLILAYAATKVTP